MEPSAAWKLLDSSVNGASRKPGHITWKDRAAADGLRSRSLQSGSGAAVTVRDTRKAGATAARTKVSKAGRRLKSRMADSGVHGSVAPAAQNAEKHVSGSSAAGTAGSIVHWGEMKKIELDVVDHRYDLPVHIDCVLQSVIMSTHERLRLELVSRLAQIHERVENALQATGMSSTADPLVVPIFKTELYLKELDKHAEICRQLKECDAKTKERLRLIEEVSEWLLSVSGYAVTETVSETVLLREDDEIDTITTNISDAVNVALTCIHKVKSIGYQLLVDSGHSCGIAHSKLKRIPVALEENVILGSYGKNLEESLLIMRRCHDEIGKMVRNDYWKGWLNVARKQMQALGHAVVKKHMDSLRMQRALVDAKSAVAKLVMANDSMSSNVKRLNGCVSKVQTENDNLKAELKHTENQMKSAIVKAHFYEQRLSRFRRDEEHQLDEQALASLLKRSDKRDSAGRLQQRATEVVAATLARGSSGVLQCDSTAEGIAASPGEYRDSGETVACSQSDVSGRGSAADTSHLPVNRDTQSFALSSAISIPEERRTSSFNRKWQPAVDARIKIGGLERTPHQAKASQHDGAKRGSRASSAGLGNLIKEKDDLLWKRAQDIISIQKEILCTFADFIEAKNVEINVDHAVDAIKDMLQDAVKKIEASMNFKMFRLDEDENVPVDTDNDPASGKSQPARTADASSSTAAIPIKLMPLPDADSTSVRKSVSGRRQSLRKCALAASSRDLGNRDQLTDRPQFLEVLPSTLSERPQSAAGGTRRKPSASLDGAAMEVMGSTLPPLLVHSAQHVPSTKVAAVEITGPDVSEVSRSDVSVHGRQTRGIGMAVAYSDACTDADVSGSVWLAPGGGSGGSGSGVATAADAALKRSVSGWSVSLHSVSQKQQEGGSRSDEDDCRSGRGTESSSSNHDVSESPAPAVCAGNRHADSLTAWQPSPTGSVLSMHSKEQYKKVRKQYKQFIQKQATVIKNLQAENLELKSNNAAHQITLQLLEMKKEEDRLKHQVAYIGHSFRGLSHIVSQIRQQQEHRYNVLLQRYDMLLKEFILCLSELRAIRTLHQQDLFGSKNTANDMTAPLLTPAAATAGPCFPADGRPLADGEIGPEPKELHAGMETMRHHQQVRDDTEFATLFDCLQVVRHKLSGQPSRQKLIRKLSHTATRVKECIQDSAAHSRTILREQHILRHGTPVAAEARPDSHGRCYRDVLTFAPAAQSCRVPKQQTCSARGKRKHARHMHGVTMPLGISHGLVATAMRLTSGAAAMCPAWEVTESDTEPIKPAIEETKLLQLDVNNWTSPLKARGKRQTLRMRTARGCYIDKDILLLPFPLKPVRSGHRCLPEHGVFKLRPLRPQQHQSGESYQHGNVTHRCKSPDSTEALVLQVPHVRII